MKLVKLVARKSLNIVVKTEQIIIGVVMLWVTTAIFIQIVLRYLLLPLPLFGIEEIVIMTAAWLYFIGVAYTTKTESHVKVEIVNLLVKKRLLVKWNRLSLLFLSIIGSGVLFYVALEHSIWAFQAGLVTSAFMIPISYTTLSIVVAGVLTFLHFSIQLARELKEWHNPDLTPSQVFKKTPDGGV